MNPDHTPLPPVQDDELRALAAEFAEVAHSNGNPDYRACYEGMIGARIRMAELMKFASDFDRGCFRPVEEAAPPRPWRRMGRIRPRSAFNLRHQDAREQRLLIDYLDAQRVQQMKGGR